MPILGILLLCAQIGLAIHAGRTGRPFFWIYLIIFVPMMGMLAYIAVELAPEWLGSRTARRAASGVGRALDPGRAVRQAERQVQITPTTENKATLAQAYLQVNRAPEAVALYRETLTGIHANDPALMQGLARALFATHDYAETVRVLDALREANPDYQSPEAHLLYARSLEEQGSIDAALHEYAALAPYYPGQEARCRYAMLLEKAGEHRDAQRLFREICQSIEISPRHARRLQREWYDIARRASEDRG
jgi:hypothetical protein